MRVALDVTPVISGSTGVARYTATLEAELRSRDIDVRAFAIGRGRGQLPPGVRRLGIPLRAVQRAWRLGLPPRAEQLVRGADLVHSCDLVPPPTRRPLVVTVHDLAALDRPDLHPVRAYRQARARLESLNDATVVLPNSQATADALARHGVSGSRVMVVRHAPPPCDEKPPMPEERPYLLAVGELAARKDYPTLLRAFATGSAGDHRLIIVGPVGFRGEETLKLAGELDLADRLVIAGRVDDGKLASLYAGATALCFPSLAEGFGLPLVEAMRAGIPIVASDIDATREIAGDAAMRFPAGDVSALAEALRTITTDAELRARLATAGKQRAGLFTWERTATGTVAAYRQALECG